MAIIELCSFANVIASVDFYGDDDSDGGAVIVRDYSERFATILMHETFSNMVEKKKLFADAFRIVADSIE